APAPVVDASDTSRRTNPGAIRSTEVSVSPTSQPIAHVEPVKHEMPATAPSADDKWIVLTTGMPMSTQTPEVKSSNPTSTPSAVDAASPKYASPDGAPSPLPVAPLPSEMGHQTQVTASDTGHNTSGTGASGAPRTHVIARGETLS